MDAKLSCDRSQREPLLPQVQGLSQVNMLLSGPAQPLPLSTSPTDSRDDAVPDQVALELGDRGQNVKE